MGVAALGKPQVVVPSPHKGNDTLNPQNAQTLAQVITTLATLCAGCWMVGKLFDYLKARLQYVGAELVPGVPSITRKAEVAEDVAR